MAMKRKDLPVLEPKVFEHGYFGKVRVVKIDNVVWFVGKDVATALGYKNTRDALAKHVDTEDKRVILKSRFATLGATLEIPNRGLIVINKSGVYSLILDSQLPEAKEYRHWITSEVLPSVDETGSYSVGQESSKKKKKELPQLPPGLLNDDPNDFGNVARLEMFLEEHGIEYDYEFKPCIIEDEDGSRRMCYSFKMVIKDD